MRATLFQTHSKGGSTIGYARIQFVSADSEGMLVGRATAYIVYMIAIGDGEQIFEVQSLGCRAKYPYFWR